MYRQDYRQSRAAQESYGHPGAMTPTFFERIAPFPEHRGLSDLDPLTMRMAANWPNREDYSVERRFGA